MVKKYENMGRINKYGGLEIKRRGRFVSTNCPFKGTGQYTFCSHTCPFFDDSDIEGIFLNCQNNPLYIKIESDDRNLNKNGGFGNG